MSQWMDSLKVICSPTTQISSKCYHPDTARWLVILFFALLYLPQTLVINYDINLISVFECDSGSIMRGIEKLLKPHYNMLYPYHSKFYGWTYFSINFFLLLPLKYILTLFATSIHHHIYFAIRLIHFTIGLAGILTFDTLLRQLNISAINSAFICIVLFTSMTLSSTFYFIHPESTGVLFLLLGVLGFINFKAKPFKTKYYWLSLSAFTLSVLSKQSFAFVCLPFLLSFYLVYCQTRNKRFWSTLLEKKTLQIGVNSLGLGLIIFFLIHPHAFLQPKEFIGYQIDLVHMHKHFKSALNRTEAIHHWIEIWMVSPVFKISLYILPLSIFSLFKRQNKFLHLAILLGIFFGTFMIMGNARLMFGLNYLTPIYPLCILNLVLTIQYLILHLPKIRYLTYLLTGYFMTAFFLIHLSQLLPRLSQRLDYKTTITYQTYEYIKNNIKADQKIVNDEFVAVPVARQQNTCHYWQGCGNDYIETFSPNYIIFNSNHTIGIKNSLSQETQRLKQYIHDHHMKKIKQLTGYNYGSTQPVHIDIYKK